MKSLRSVSRSLVLPQTRFGDPRGSATCELSPPPHSATVSQTVPQRLYTLEELKLSGIEASSLLSPVDTTLSSIERNLQIAALIGGLTASNAFAMIGLTSITRRYYSLLFLWTLDSVSFSGGVGSLVVDTISHIFSQKYHNQISSLAKSVRMLADMEESVGQILKRAELEALAIRSGNGLLLKGGKEA